LNHERAAMSLLPAPSAPSPWQRAWEVVSDLLIATALIWTLPLLLGAGVALVEFLLSLRK